VTDDPRTPPGGLAIDQPLRCPSCDHLTSDHWPDGSQRGSSGCFVTFGGQLCSCSLDPEAIVAAVVLNRIEKVVETGVAPPLPRTSVVTAVSADLDAMPLKPGGVTRSLRALAMYLAEAVDAHGAAENPSTTARLAQELRTVLGEIARQDTTEDDDVASFAQTLGTPERGRTDGQLEEVDPL